MQPGKLAILILLAAAGVATGATVAAFATTGAVPWSRALTIVLLLGAALTASRLVARDGAQK